MHFAGLGPNVIILLIAFAGIAISSEYVVKYAVILSNKVKLSPAIIGSTVVALGSALPEMVVSLEAALQGNGGISIGNAIGSNITNTLVSIGLVGLIYPFAIARNYILIGSTFFLLIAKFAFSYFVWDSILTQIEGIVLLLILFVYITFLIKNRHRGNTDEVMEMLEESEEEEGGKPVSTVSLLIKIALSLAALIYVSEVLLESAQKIAEIMEISGTVVGLLIISLGTSLPELAISVSGAFKKQTELVAGNIIGANTFNALFVPSIPALFTTVQTETQVHFPLIVMVSGIVVLSLFVFNQKLKINRPVAISFLAFYAYYVANII